jgi:serine/threonine protein kinase
MNNRFDRPVANRSETDVVTPERWLQIQRLYHEAVTCTREQREEFLTAACDGDDDLRAEVESLLAQEDAARGFLSGPDALAALAPGPGREVLANGTELGTYRILSPLGAGGMGEVYRAHDVSLGRDVAIKVLPSVWFSDAQRRIRFEREARLLAALNNPHIAAIYGLVQADGISGLVLELVDGPTLAEWLENGPIPLEESLTIAIQIADALEASHEKSIVHRDLKPANIALVADPFTPARTLVKVLDFGIALGAADRQSADGRFRAGPVADTVAGAVPGTPGYMSPEQARGKMVDKRTDIWAFGCVLHEMLTGRATFSGDTTSDTIRAVLEHEPDWKALPEATPPAIAGLLRRCLRKDPRQRLHDIADARIDIEEALQTLQDGRTRRHGVAGSSRRTLLRYWPLLLCVTAALLAVVWFLAFASLQQAAPRNSYQRRLFSLDTGKTRVISTFAAAYFQGNLSAFKDTVLVSADGSIDVDLMMVDHASAAVAGR